MNEELKKENNLKMEESYNDENNEKKETKKKRHIIRNILVILLITFLTIICILTMNLEKVEKEYIKYILQVKNVYIEDGKIKVSLNHSFIDQNRYCQILEKTGEINKDKWVQVVDDKCILELEENSEYIIVKDKGTVSQEIPLKNYLNEIIDIKYSKERIIVVKDEEKILNLDIKSIGSPSKTVKLISENEEIAKTDGMKIIGVNVGNTNIKISDNNNHEVTVPVIVTDLITTPQLNEKKEFLPNDAYTEEEAHLLDEILEERVNDAGLKTRAGVVAAARFITLEFKYKVPYFLENGRFQNNGYSRPIDGEGRYYHKGLYLSKDKFEIIKKSRTTPVIWGNILFEASTGKYRKNGLDCSGFVTWALYNGGFDPGDIGAGPGEGYAALPDYGVSQAITVENLKSGNIKAGDLIGWSGHIGLIIGIDENYIYTADTIRYDKGLVATKYTHEDFVKKSGFTGLYSMSQYYKEDGNYTNMF